MSALPLPPELAAPEPDAERWVQGVVDEAVALANDAGLDPEEAGAQLATWDEEAPAPEGPQRWRVTDDGGAEWALRHVAEAEAELAQLREQADHWAAKISDWFDHRARPLRARVGFFSAHLEAYALERRYANPKAKTLTLPSGRVQTTFVAPRAEVSDPGAVVAWAEAPVPGERHRRNPARRPLRRRTRADQVLKVTKRVDVAGLRSALVPGAAVAADTGEVVPGVYVAPARVNATVKVDKP